MRRRFRSDALPTALVLPSGAMQYGGYRLIVAWWVGGGRR
eukprot:COSAG01_NODE_54966_length_328_cov_1.113537_1_plen_39_part_10